MSFRALAFIVEGKAGIPIQLERNDGFNQTLPTNGDGYVVFPEVPESPWNVNIHIHAAGYESYDYVLGSIIPGGIPAGNHNLFVGAPEHPITPGFDIVLPGLVARALPAILAGRWDFLEVLTGARHVVVGSTELMLAWRYDLEGADAIRPVLEQRQALRFNNLRFLWQKGPGSNGLQGPWLMPVGKMAPFLGLLAEYRFYGEGCILADCQSVNPSESDQQARVGAVRSATAGISNHFEQLGNEYQKNGHDPRHFGRPADRLASNSSAVEGGEDAPYWDYFTFSGEREPAQKAIREYGPVEFLYGDRGSWGGLPAICGEGFKPGQTSSEPRDFERAGAQARSVNGGRYHTDAGTAGNCRLYNTLELVCGRAFVKGLLACFLVLLALPAAAQEPVRPVPDAISWGTAAVNPSIALVKALRSDRPVCEALRLGVSELVGNAATLTIKHFVRSPRPCLGCGADGMPSGHTMNSVLGSSSSGWVVGVSMPVLTGALRWQANRHTWRQVAAGAALGAGSELAGRLVRCN